MIQSLCVLGRQPKLGLAELESLYSAERVMPVGRFAAGLDLPHSEVDFSRLGGSTRLAAVLAEVPGTNWKLIEKELQKIVRSPAFDVPTEGKFHLGLSAYGFDVSPAKLSALGLTLKKLVRSRGISVRLVPNNERELNTAQVYHNHLSDEHGAELVIVADKNRTVIARTVAVQDIDSYTQRDRGRPRRDARVGMLPPKLAQIIINLAASQTDPKFGSVVLDPFCGTGVVLLEASLMGFDVYGSDLEPRMVEYSEANLEWLQSLPENKIIAHGEGIAPLEVGDATAHQWQPVPNIVACETYLGRPFTTLPDHQTLEQNVSDVNAIIRKFLQNIHGQLAPGTRLCVAVPAWHLGSSRFRYLPLVDQISDLGYNRVEFERVSNHDLLYYREDQLVARQLLVLSRK